MGTHDRFCSRVYPEVNPKEDTKLNYSPNPLNQDKSTTLVVEDENDDNLFYEKPESE